MATTNIELDIENITGVADADDQFVKSGQKFVVASMPKELLKWAGTSTAVGSHGGDSSPTAITLPQPTSNILDVSRNGFSAEEVPESMQGFIANSSSLHLATETFPKYYLQAGNKVVVKPDPSDSETALVNYVDFLKIDDDCDLRNAVVFHAASKEFEKLATGQSSDVTTALTAINTELDETQAICDLINTQVDAAVVELAESATLVDNNIDTACAAIATAAGRINTAVGLANGQYDQAVLESAQAEAEADDGAIATALGLINDQVDSAVSSLGSATTAIGAANTEAAELAAQTDNSGNIETAADGMATAVAQFRASSGDPTIFGDETRYVTATTPGIKKVKDALDKAIAFIDGDSPTTTSDVHHWITDEDSEMAAVVLQAVQSQVGIANVQLQEFSTTVQALTAEINGFASEVSARAGFSGAKAQSIQGYINVASAHASASQAYVNAAQGYLAEVQAYQTSVGIFSATAQNRINTGNAFLAEANASAQEAQTYSAEVQSRLGQVQGQTGVAQSYIAAAQGYSGELQSKIGIGQGYSNEIQSRLSVKMEHSKSADRYYQMAQLEVSNYIKNSSQMINKTLMAQAAQQG